MKCALLLLLISVLEVAAQPFLMNPALVAARTAPAAGGGGSVAHDGEANTTGTSTAALTLTITGKTTAGANRVGMVSVAWNNATPVITGATWNGVAMTIVDQGAETASASLGAALLRIVNPPTGAANIVITWDLVATARAVAHSYNGVDQTTPISASNKVISVSNADDPSNTVATTTGEVVVDSVCWTQFDSAVAVVGADQTSLANLLYAAFYFHSASRQAGASGGVMSWDTDEGANFVSIAASIKAAP